MSFQTNLDEQFETEITMLIREQRSIMKKTELDFLAKEQDIRKRMSIILCIIIIIIIYNF